MSFTKGFFLTSTLISETAESPKDFQANVLEVYSSGLSGFLLYAANVDCHSFLLTGLLQLQHSVSLQIRRYSSSLNFWNAAFPALAFHDCSFSPGAFTAPSSLTHVSFFPSFTMDFFSSTIPLFFLPPSIVHSCSGWVPLIHSLPASSALSFYCHDN